MAMYYFNLHDDQSLEDPDGTDLPDEESAHSHAAQVIEELTRNSSGLLGRAWASWTMVVNNDKGERVFSVSLANRPIINGP
jgi:hypothetical protein